MESSSDGVREATVEDIPRLCPLLELLFAQEAEFRPDSAKQSAALRQIIENPATGRILVFVAGSKLVGMVNLLFTVSTALGGRVAILEDMVVDPASRGAGIGSHLMRGAIDLARRSGCHRITLLTDHDNAEAIRFYRSHGFTLSGMVPLRLLF